MERVTFKTLFYVKKTRVAKNGEVPVMLRITVNGLRVETSVNLKVNPKKWNAVAGRSIGDTRKDDEVNARLDTIRMRVMQIHREMELDREAISAQRVIDRYLGRDTKPVIMLLDLFREHNESQIRSALRAKYRYDFASDGDIRDMQYLIKKGLAKHEFGDKNPGIDKIVRIPNSNLPKRENIDQLMLDKGL